VDGAAFHRRLQGFTLIAWGHAAGLRLLFCLAYGCQPVTLLWLAHALLTLIAPGTCYGQLDITAAAPPPPNALKHWLPWCLMHSPSLPSTTAR
jgi:hypothetical protein